MYRENQNEQKQSKESFTSFTISLNGPQVLTEHSAFDLQGVVSVCCFQKHHTCTDSKK